MIFVFYFFYFRFFFDTLLSFPFVSKGGVDKDYHSKETDCEVCKGSSYADATGTGSCKSCPKSFSIDSPDVLDHVSEEDCVKNCPSDQHLIYSNKTCQECRDGYKCNGEVEILCEPGTYCTKSIQTFCPAGTYGIKQGQATNTACIACPKGTYQPGQASKYCVDW